MRSVVLALLALALLLAPAAADAAAAERTLLLLHDAPADGRVVAGSLAHFGFALVDADGRPVVHHDHHVTVTQNGRVLVATEDAHEYDGLFTVAVTFPEPGPYEVAARAVRGGETVAEASFAGVAVAPGPLQPTLDVALPTDAVAREPAELRVAVRDADGASLQWSDVLVEARRLPDGLLVLRAHLHPHGGEAALRFAFPSPGDYALTFTGFNAFPNGLGPDFASVVRTERVSVAGGVPASPAPADPEGEATGADDAPYLLYTTTDPTPLAGQKVIGPMTQMRLAGLVVDATTREAVPHVDFDARLVGPHGVVFESASLHEYDGHHELVVAGLAIGEHAFTLEASRGDWRAAGREAFRVVPPVVPLGAGPYLVSLESAPTATAREPLEVVLAAKNPAGVPLTHTELDLTFLSPDELATPLAQFKVHTHGDGLYRATVALPAEGRWRLVVDPTPLEPRPVLVLGPDGPGAPIAFALDVAPASSPLDGAGVAADGMPTPAIPGPTLPGALGGLLAAALLARRR